MTGRRSPGTTANEDAVLIKEKLSGKTGIVVIHRRDRSRHILGAGQTNGNGGDDFSWMDAWQVYERGVVQRGADESPPPVLRGDALYVEKTESASAIIWWNGKRYRWYQQGD